MHADDMWDMGADDLAEYDRWEADRDEYENRRDDWIATRAYELASDIYPVPLPRTDMVDAWEVWDAVGGTEPGIMTGDDAADEAHRLCTEYATEQFEEGED